MTNKSSSEPSYFKKSVQLLFDYFKNSENKWRAYALLSGSVLCVLALSALGFILGWWCFPYIFAAFIAKDLTLFAMGIGAGLLIAGAMAGFNYLANLLKNQVYVDWRSWLTKKIINQYLNSKTNYLEISRIYKDLDNPEQRIQEDIDKIVDSSLELTIGFIDNFCNLTMYIILLGMAGSSVAFPFLGPGYLILTALLVGGLSSLIGYSISSHLNKLTNDETRAQSNLRGTLHQLKNSAEEIAIEQAEKYYKNRLENEVDSLNTKTINRLSIENRVKTFNMFNSVFQVIVPFVIAIPLYLTDLISLEVYYSVGYYFSMVARSLNWFIQSFDVINKFRTSLNRVNELQTILNKTNEAESTQKIIHIIGENTKNLEVKNLELKLHGSNELLIKGLNLKFKRGIHTLIQAPSGTGKSSLFKAIAGTWLSGEGNILIPKSRESIYFLPQKPTLPDDTLRNVLAYPDSYCPYSDEELISALKAVNMEALTNKLDEKIGFKSLGEQQRIAFARVLLRKPEWLFLDEATASLDEDIEAQVYQLIKKLLPNTTIISIAHRSTVKRYHDNILFFRTNENKEVHVETEKISDLFPSYKTAQV
ncbi:ABC transporter [Legionella steigerwaltii]|uniref:ABC transporter n=1 Tax=Legionella steigerwaltii TaxID=460 RepID=A0A378LB54_9GAMM|nr:ATP-binding cassette domain-containing protein [Legionella steigerwaltii]KTD78565.1 ABC transporter [Legionella steigerwaltii]STY24076.1 ABC transporter [Legionella steigerwaltii]